MGVNPLTRGRVLGAAETDGTTHSGYDGNDSAEEMNETEEEEDEDDDDDDDDDVDSSCVSIDGGGSGYREATVKKRPTGRSPFGKVWNPVL
jgi:hypothetical protein